MPASRRLSSSEANCDPNRETPSATRPKRARGHNSAGSAPPPRSEGPALGAWPGSYRPIRAARFGHVTAGRARVSCLPPRSSAQRGERPLPPRRRGASRESNADILASRWSGAGWHRALEPRAVKCRGSGTSDGGAPRTAGTSGLPWLLLAASSQAPGTPRPWTCTSRGRKRRPGLQASVGASARMISRLLRIFVATCHYTH